MDFAMSDIDRVTIIACGTASYVGMIANTGSSSWRA